MEGLSSEVLMTTLSYVSSSSMTLRQLRYLCKTLSATLHEATAWQFLARVLFGVVSPGALRGLSLYEALETWAPRVGYYTAATAYPWGVLCKVSIEDGVAEGVVIRFKDATTQVRVPLFRCKLDDCNIAKNVSPDQLRPKLAIVRRFFGPLCATQAVEGCLLLPGCESAFRLVDPSAPRPCPPRLFDREWHFQSDATDDLDVRTVRMVRDLIAGTGCDLAKIPPAVNGPLAGLYVGDYGDESYGQFRTQVVRLDYVSLTTNELREELERPPERRRLFTRPRWCFVKDGRRSDRVGLWRALSPLIEPPRDEPTVFVRATKVCGDYHCPMGVVTFVAVVSPDDAQASLTDSLGADGAVPPAAVLDGQGKRRKVASHAPGVGTLAAPGFRNPTWAPGFLLHFDDPKPTLGFAWLTKDPDRPDVNVLNHSAVLLHPLASSS